MDDESCFCGEAEGGDMIGCDGCPRWFHITCAGLTATTIPCENWYCAFCINERKDLKTDNEAAEIQINSMEDVVSFICKELQLQTPRIGLLSCILGELEEAEAK